MVGRRVLATIKSPFDLAQVPDNFRGIPEPRKKILTSPKLGNVDNETSSRGTQDDHRNQNSRPGEPTYLDIRLTGFRCGGFGATTEPSAKGVCVCSSSESAWKRKEREYTSVDFLDESIVKEFTQR
ncbi:hypothetical protein OPV22_033806 [Ensete ventricosum]|uniref:Uncharacterized protein n=1 Tax=Ensete ventricosum TaxID=4639 RepID=A0AAV8PSX3_ENSVE|nr:hypothetical protein OPV22_033806 [Ensete ventricosum]